MVAIDTILFTLIKYNKIKKSKKQSINYDA